MSTERREKLRVSISEECIECGLCQKACRFLRKYGTPKEFVTKLADLEMEELAFSCSLCGLCQAVCPKKIDTSALMLVLRKEAVAEGQGRFGEHCVIRRYESKGVSPLFTWYTLPEGCDTVFFPGCALPGSRPQSTRRLFTLLADKIPHLGMVLDCCTKPSHDLGDFTRFSTYFDEVVDYLTFRGIEKVIVACPNCYKVFKRYGKGVAVTTVWEYLEKIPADQAVATATVTIHDPCVMRDEVVIQDQVRHIINQCNCTVEEMPHSRKKTVCCGEGGSVGWIDPELAETWGTIRKQEAEDQKVITYCAGCANLLQGKKINASHLLDLYFEPHITLSGRERVSRAPFTYWNRLRLKRYLQKNLPGQDSRKRPILEKRSIGATYKKISLFLSLGVLAIILRFTGIASLDPAGLRDIVQHYPILAPFIYLLLYAIAPSLFVPGIPLAILAGMLFGPFWGTILALSGATIGATMAFLLGRYIGRDWVARRLSGPNWKKLEEGVAEKGWKMVALTRLIPVFPFNLLNYGFGLTGIPFWHFVLPTFVFMLPGCLAFVVFSSSFLDIPSGNVTKEFYIGSGLLVTLLLLPLLYRRIRRKVNSCHVEL